MALEAEILKSKCSLLVMVFGLYHPREEGKRMRERAGQKGKEIRFYPAIKGPHSTDPFLSLCGPTVRDHISPHWAFGVKFPVHELYGAYSDHSKSTSWCESKLSSFWNNLPQTHERGEQKLDHATCLLLYPVPAYPLLMRWAAVNTIFQTKRWVVIFLSLSYLTTVYCFSNLVPSPSCN